MSEEKKTGKRKRKGEISDEDCVRLAEQALIKIAVGYRYTEVTCQPDKDTGEMVPVKVVEKESPPNTTALFFLLRNRNPKRWSDKPENDSIMENAGGVVLLPAVTDGEIVNPFQEVSTPDTL